MSIYLPPYIFAFLGAEDSLPASMRLSKFRSTLTAMDSGYLNMVLFGDSSQIMRFTVIPDCISIQPQLCCNQTVTMSVFSKEFDLFLLLRSKLCHL